MIPPYKSFPLAVRLLVIFILFAFNYLLFPSLASLFVIPFYGMERLQNVFSGNFVTQGDKYVFLFVQAVGSLGGFAFTSLLVSQLETGFVSKRLGLVLKPSFKFIALAIVGILASQLFIQLLVDLNERIPLPNALKALVEQGKKEEALMNALLKGSSFLQFLANVLVLAIIPAFGEELFFRGLLLGDLLKSKVNPAFAIIATGLVFSIAHTEVNNVLAIWVLGAFLGYLYYVSGSLYLSMCAHFLNNFLVVLFKYLYSTGLIGADIADGDAPVYATVISIVIFLACVFMLNKWRKPVDFEIVLNEPPFINEENYQE